MPPRPKKQHIVPRFYLARFCDENGKVWTHTLNAAPLPRPPEETATETNFYSPVDDSGQRIDQLEDVLGTIESGAAPLWDDLLSGRTQAGENRDSIALFFAAQYLRSPASVRAAAEMFAHLTYHTSKFIASHKEAHESMVDSFEQSEGSKISPEERQAMREFIRDPKNLKINVLRSVGLPILGGVGHLADIFRDMRWMIASSSTQRLVTSDSPVVRVSDPSTHSALFGDGGFQNKTVRVTFPLSPKRIVEMSWDGKELGRVFELPKDMAKAMNRIRVTGADRFVYCDGLDVGISKLCNKWLRTPQTTDHIHSRDTPAIEVLRKLGQD